jgi:cob(I)alamin adenosyltransferase
MSIEKNINSEHKKRMQKQKAEVDARIANARISKGIVILLYGHGKGKSSSAFGTLARSIGHGKKAGIVQFIKGKWKTGEQKFFMGMDNVDYQIMGTGFTWDTQDREKDIEAAEKVWEKAELMLKDPELKIILFDEITYMFKYEYLSVKKVVDAILARPPKQNVILTGRDPVPELLEIADTVSEVKEIKHAFKQGVKAQKGIEY